METGRRIAELIERFEQQILTREVLNPKEISLNLKDATVDEAIAELTKASGYAVQIQGDRTGFADKKISLKADKRSFWRLLDQICDAAGLMEHIDLSVTQVSSSTVRIMAKKGLQRAVVYGLSDVAAGPIKLIQRGGASARQLRRGHADPAQDHPR